ncbi:uncharacterized protein LACBIDRAFT_313633 [Laccaria bicolor S238N-H82]|uniref:Predicted protein n=1 Tax=Laccaria bicolor (strain S238N-H82 / ATCC MYA-4686) TaxID=486041 RepID=B0D0G1_LACBS|nr:uncharacterized protein LACBIDRAFT_313633 [Laccaria bicolor S238N-H82]EDR11451.1 predicted protein [Laccaria bicolor S238N-H82]|eukprot:XP_001877348.1 predicted protein [Laccaria bicolor S238N-H82]
MVVITRSHIPNTYRTSTISRIRHCIPLNIANYYYRRLGSSLVYIDSFDGAENMTCNMMTLFMLHC